MSSGLDASSPAAPVWTPDAGLSAAEARARLHAHGPNELPQAPRRTLLRIAIGVLREPMFLLLVLAAAVYLAIGDPHEALLLGAFALLSIGLVVIQEHRSERALDALRALSAPQARVLRDGQIQRIPARELVPGDLLLVSEGDRLAADGLLRRADDVEVDESLLTGESLPVSKRALTAAEAMPTDSQCVWGGTLMVRGHAVLQVSATGSATAAGRIGLALAGIEVEQALLQRSVGKLVRLFGTLALLVSSAVVLGYGLLRGAWVDGILSGIALAMALLPEEFPMALAVFMALGAWRLAQVRVLVRRPAVIETLGATTLLCVDKTGTLTENRMRVQALWVPEQGVLRLRGDESELPESHHRLLEFGLLASKRQAHDPMDQALNRLGAHTLADTEHLHGDWPLEREYGLSPDLPALSRIWLNPEGQRMAAAKGAPEAIAELCQLSADARQRMLAAVEAEAAAGLRVLAVASTPVGTGDLPDSPRGLVWQFEGLLAFADPLRANAAAAVAEARAAGIDVAMITGDYPLTARAIAAEAGLDLAGGVLSGADIERMPPAELAQAVRRTRVYARVKPEQKLKLVQAFKADGEVVAMTGDGVNDAPALKAAHIGLAMAGRGTDVAREAASIALLDDDLSRIVGGIRLGRRIFENLRKVLIYIAAVHIPIAGLALLPMLLGWPPLLLPMHVVLIEMVIDPICSVAFEGLPEDSDLMRRQPRRADEPLIGARQLWIALALGLLLLGACLAVAALMRAAGQSEAEIRTLAFLALTAGNLCLVRVTSTHAATLPRLFAPGHRPFWIVAALASAVVAASILVPSLAQLFGFATPDPAAALAAITAGIASVLLFDLVKSKPAIRSALAVGR